MEKCTFPFSECPGQSATFQRPDLLANRDLVRLPFFVHGLQQTFRYWTVYQRHQQNSDFWALCGYNSLWCPYLGDCPCIRYSHAFQEDQACFPCPQCCSPGDLYGLPDRDDPVRQGKAVPLWRCHRINGVDPSPGI